MKKFKDPNYIAKLEKAISKKYGVEAIENPRKHWSDLDEKEYEKQLQKLTKKQNRLHDQSEKIEVDGVLISKKLLNKESVDRTCPVCNTYSFDLKDDVYMKKFDCCYQCYFQWVEGREERWKTGWRPKQAGDE